MTTNKGKNTLTGLVIAELQSDDPARVATALAKIQEVGDKNLVYPLIQLFASTESRQTRDSVASLLGSLKISDTEEHFMQALRDDALKSHRKEILSFMWNSGLHPAEHLEELTQLALDSSYEELLECLTLVESLEGPFEEEHWLESVSLVKQFIEQHATDERMPLLKEYMMVLQVLQQYVD